MNNSNKLPKIRIQSHDLYSIGVMIVIIDDVTQYVAYTKDGRYNDVGESASAALANLAELLEEVEHTRH